MKRTRRWYYVSYYEAYPIFEPAEGGYYYEGEALEQFERFGSLKSARRFFRKKLEECGGASYFDAVTPFEARKKESGKVGDGWRLRIETVLGKHAHGWHSYC